MRIRSRLLNGAFVLSLIWIGIFAPGTVAAQDGRLLDQTPVTLGQDDLKALNAAARDALKQVEIKAITYLSDGLRVKGYLVMPRQGDKLPCVIYNRGGTGDFGAITDRQAASQLARIASWGYAVVASQYRGNAGSEGIEDWGGRDVNDVLNLIPLLESVPRTDTSRIGMYGGSRGGTMTYIALTRTDRVAAAVVLAGGADLFAGAQHRPEMEREVWAKLIPDFERTREEALRARSAVFWAEKIHKKTPLLLLHGSADWRVHPTEALRMALKLYEAKHPFRFIFFEGADHGLTEYRDEVYTHIRQWFDRYVRDRQAWPSLEPHGQ